MSDRSIYRGASTVALGTLAVQVGGVLGQFLYAVWLPPSEFGVWATASASLVVFTALTNGGESNGYLANPNPRAGDALKRSFRINCILAIGALCLGLAFYGLGRVEVGIIVCILALELPLQGRGSLLLSAFIKTRLHTRLVHAQALATCVRLCCGLVAAVALGSGVALAIALLSYSVTLNILLVVFARRSRPEIFEIGALGDVGRGLRLDRALHQLSQAIPAQVDYLVITVIASPSLLGVYYLAYQATTAVTVLVVGPLSRTIVAELTQMPAADRPDTVGRLLVVIVGLSTVAALGGSLLIYRMQDWVPATWIDVLGPVAILMASVPARFMAPLSEALNMVSGRWRRSSLINCIDAVGTGCGALFALSGDVTLLAVGVGAWKVAFGCGRVLLILQGRRVSVVVTLVVPVLLVFAGVVWWRLIDDSVGYVVMAAVLAISVLQATVGRRLFT